MVCGSEPFSMRAPNFRKSWPEELMGSSAVNFLESNKTVHCGPCLSSEITILSWLQDGTLRRSAVGREAVFVRGLQGHE